VALDGARINGELSFIGVTIGADADFGGAILANGDKDVLTLDGCTVTGNLLFTNGFAATGTVRLIGSDLSSSLQCDEASFRRPNGVALALDQATIGTLELRATTFAGSLRLYRTSVDILDDDLGTGDQKLGSWASASPLVVTGVTVQRFASGDDVTLRKNWLLKNDHFDPGTWQSLIDLYRIHGREGDARAAAIARESDRLDRGGLRWWQKPGPWIFGAVIGYGYRPLQAGAWALGIVAVFALLVAQGDAHIVALKDAPHPKPNSVIYALDVFLPVIDFGEAKNWRVEDWLEWAQWGVIALGWTLTTLFVAGFTRLVRS
jgi:hypothetical protein